jgi:hypothetical protein
MNWHRRPLKGSREHRDLFCKSFLETHVPFDPSKIVWPELDRGALERLKALPFWGEAITTETTTASWVRAFASAESDPVVREALELQAREEARHAAVLRGLVEHYAIPVEPVPPDPLPRELVWAFLRTGWGECLDSFFAFGLFAVARRSGFFPAPLVAIFDPLLQEEARHVIFFVNWAAWQSARLGLKARFRHRALSGLALAHQAWGRVQMARGIDKPHFTVTGHEAIDASISIGALLELCLSENERRSSLYDARLLRPRIVPALAKVARFVVALGESESVASELVRLGSAYVSGKPVGVGAE